MTTTIQKPANHDQRQAVGPDYNRITAFRTFTWPWEEEPREEPGAMFKASPEIVKKCVAGTMRIIAAMDKPSDAPRHVKAFWVDIVRDLRKDYIDPCRPPRLRVTPEQVDAADEVTLWILSLPSKRDRVIVSARGLGVPHKKLALILGVRERTVQLLYKQAIDQICETLTKAYWSNEAVVIALDGLAEDMTAPSFGQASLQQIK